ncbi:MAG: RidA family protein [Fusobacteriaceae bacterium]
MRRIINTKKAPAAIGPYSQAVEINGTLYVSGQIPFVPETMTVISQDIKEQTRQSLENVKAILEAAEYTLADVVKASVFIKNMDDFASINEVYNEYLGDIKPARACVEVARLPRDVQVEIEVIAAKSTGEPKFHQTF